MKQKLLKGLLLYSVLNSLSIVLCFGRSVGKFCDNSFIDAVLWDGLSYRLTRNEWIATYDNKTGTVDQFVHKSDDYFQNEKAYYYQSVYYIPTVPECNETTVSCQMMNKLQGLTVCAIRRYYSSNKESFEVIHRIYRNGNGIPLKEDINIETFIESNLLPSKRLPQKYRPSVYSPKDFTFIHITNQLENFGPLLETIELHTNGVIERSYHELNEYKDIVFITSFWWTYDRKVYVIGEHKSGFGNPFIYELELKNKNLLLKPINKSVLEFFGCNRPWTNHLENSIRNKISDHDLGQWSVQLFETTTTKPQKRFLNEVTDQTPRIQTKQSTYQTTRAWPVPDRRPVQVSTAPTYHINSQTRDRRLDQNYSYKSDQISYQRRDRYSQRTAYSISPSTEPMRATDQRRPFQETKTFRPTPDPRKHSTTHQWMTNQRIDYRLDKRTDQTYIETADVVRVTAEQKVYQVESTRLSSTPKAFTDQNNGIKTDQMFGQNLQQTTFAQSVTSLENIPKKSQDISINVLHNKNPKGYVSLKVSEFWKIFPTIFMLTLLFLAVSLLIVGYFAVSNLGRLLRANVNETKLKSFNGEKKQRLKYDTDLSDFFIEEYDTTGKQPSPSTDNSSCQTNDSFEGPECEPARTIL